MEKKRNLWVIPTGKPSRLRYFCGKLEKMYAIPKKSDIVFQNIYITSDVEIKEGDSFLTPNNRIFRCHKAKNATIYYVSNSGTLNIDPEYCRKIILTTDPDLIADGVQAIDDTFLEWFVKNPSCESVEVKKENQFFRSGPLDLLGYSVVSYKIIIPEKITRCCGRCNGIDDLCYTDMTCDNHNERGCEICYGKRVEYKIAIPQEEPKQHVDFINQNIEEFNENLENFKKLVSDETSPALKEFAKTFKNHCLECNKNLENCSCIDNWLEKHGDPEIAKQVEKEAKELHEQATLEEAYLNQLIDEANKEFPLDRKLAKDVAIRYAKWQAERIGLMEIELNHTKILVYSCERALEERNEQIKRMYSEEEVMEMFHNLSMHLPLHYEFLVKQQFKNK